MAYMIQSLAKPDQAPQDDDPSRRALVNDAAPLSADDSGQGLALFVLFTVAVLLSTGAVAFLALLTSWWALGVVFGLHALVTVIVGTAVFGVLSSDPWVERDNVVQLGVVTSPEGRVQLRARSRQASSIAA